MYPPEDLIIWATICADRVRQHETRKERVRCGTNVVDQAVLVPDAELLELGLVLGVVDLLERVFPLTVVALEDRVLGRHVQRQLLLNRELERALRKVGDALLRVVHGESDSRALEVEHLEVGGLLRLVVRRVDELELARLGDDNVGRAVLVTERVAADDDGLGPAGDGLGNLLDDDRLAEDGAAENVADRAVRGLRVSARVSVVVRAERDWARLTGRTFHIFLSLNSSTRASSGVIVAHCDALVSTRTSRSERRTHLDADAVLEDGLGGVDRDLIVGLVAVLESEVVVLDVDVEEGEDEVLLDLVPAVKECHPGAVSERSERQALAAAVCTPASRDAAGQRNGLHAHDAGHLVSVHLVAGVPCQRVRVGLR